MTFEQLSNELEICNQLSIKCKRQAMIYQYHEKHNLANFIGTRPDRFDHWRYRFWGWLSAKWMKFQNDAMNDYHQNPEIYTDCTTCGQIWTKYNTKYPFIKLRKEM